MKSSGTPRSGYYPTDSTIDDSPDQIGNGTSAITGPDKTPYEGSQGFEHLRYSEPNAGDALEHDIEMYLVDEGLQEWRPNEPCYLRSCQMIHSQYPMSICDTQAASAPSNVDQDNLGQLEPPHNNTCMHCTQNSGLPRFVDLHLPILAIHDDANSSYINPQHIEPFAFEHHYPSTSGLGQDMAILDKSQTSQGGDVADGPGLIYPSRLHEGRKDASLAPRGPVLGGRDAPWSTNTPRSNHQMILAQHVNNLVNVISTSGVGRTRDAVNMDHGSDLGTAGFHHVSYSHNLGPRSGYGGCGELIIPLRPAEAQQNAVVSSSRSNDGYDVTPTRYHNYLGTPMSVVPSSEISSLAGSAPSNVLRCPLCPARFTGTHRRGNFGRHRRQKHIGVRKTLLCENQHCSRVFLRSDARLKHYRVHHPEVLVPTAN